MSTGTIKNIVQVGASGSLGTPVFDALVASKKFNITVLVRETSKSTFPASVKVSRVDFKSNSSLVNALKGHDAVILTHGGQDTFVIQRAVLDAAVEARVPYIVPSSFGIDTLSETAGPSPILNQKLESETYLRQLTAEGKINYLTIFVGTFFEWGLTTTFDGIDLVNKKASLFKDSPPVHFTTLGNIGQAVVGALSDPERFANKPIRVHDFFVSPHDILKIAEEELGEKFEVIEEDVEDAEKRYVEALQKGVVEAEFGLIKIACVSPKSIGCMWDLDDESVSLGLKKKDLREEVVKVLRELNLKN